VAVLDPLDVVLLDPLDEAVVLLDPLDEAVVLLESLEDVAAVVLLDPLDEAVVLLESLEDVAAVFVLLAEAAVVLELSTLVADDVSGCLEVAVDAD